MARAAVRQSTDNTDGIGSVTRRPLQHYLQVAAESMGQIVDLKGQMGDFVVVSNRLSATESWLATLVTRFADPVVFWRALFLPLFGCRNGPGVFAGDAARFQAYNQD